MVTKLHRHMGALIRENVLSSLPREKHIRISPFWYAVGNMLPDVSWLPLTHPHFQTKSFSFMTELLEKSLHKHKKQKINAFFISPIFSIRLGIICHYLCDFFCVAHQGEGINGARHHLDYEHSMRDFFYDHKTEIETLCRYSPQQITDISQPTTTDALLEEFRKWHDNYSKQQSTFIQSFLNTEKYAEDVVDAFLTDIQTAIACCTTLIYRFALQEI